MPAAYLTLLSIALGSGWIYLRTSADVPFVLAALTAVICFIWGFALAPWLVQLSIVGALVGLEKLYWSSARLRRN
ncbi:hypothetical protein JJD41_07875 [Oxynema sp. CENA135]|jgi:hypothetical protein|uniref:Uncharacterized protein n=1 Tax=Oxynema aestuarii AP17 TaxID=2064643 RepID=A0A6H1U4G8_9CYAN|nr:MULTISPECIES: hypothetical protein [Oxynema]MBK4729786.1 hypothetical protein [Oxynema sp. CENA135]QIZ73731.1 hypothetical protein HCG48_13015 [Oxynema aestuarii AP17]RMH77431.1 MAG: hypothetical protein D6680_05105 [Cyanobacteria bacterium J007]